MYSTFHGIELVKRSLMVNRQVMDTISHNVANANTDGYSRQRVLLTAEAPLATLQMTTIGTAGQMGQGVVAKTVERIRSEFLDGQYRVENQILGHWNTRYDSLQQVELLLNEPSDEALRASIDDFWTAWQDLANDPQTSATRKVVVEKGISLSNSLKETYTELLSIQENHNFELENVVSQVNRIADDIADLNLKIKRVGAAGDNPNDLMDKRDLLIDELSGLVNIDLGRVSREQTIITINGQTIVQDDRVNHLTLERNADNNNYWDIHWENNDVSLSSDENTATVFADSSVSNQTDHLEIKQLAKKHQLISKNGAASLKHVLAEDDSTITSGSFTINGTSIFVDVNNDSIEEIIRKINDATVGVKATYSEDAQPRIVLESAQEGVDNGIFLQSGSSNFLRKMGLVAGMEGNLEIIDKDAALFGAGAPLGASGISPLSFTINGKTVNVETDANPNGSYSLTDLVNEINNTADIGVSASILKKSTGKYSLVLEGKDGNYNVTLNDTDGVLNSLGFGTAGSEIIGSCLSGKIVEDQLEKDLLGGATASSFQMTDSLGVSFNVTVNPGSDSLEDIKNEINNQAALSGASIISKIYQTPEGEYRLSISSVDGGKWSIADTDANPLDGTILDTLKISSGTYNELGPVSISPQNSVFLFNGKEYERQSNRVTDVVSGMTFSMHDMGSVEIQVRQLFTGGKIKGLLEARDEVVPHYLQQLDELAYSVMKNLNSVHFGGFGLNGESGHAFFDPFYSGVSGDVSRGAALSIDVRQDVYDNINLVAAAGASENEFTPEGLPIFSGPGDGSNALKLAQIKQQRILNQNQASFSEFFTAMVSKAGVDAEVASRLKENRELLVDKIESQRMSVSGVSLDEEMSNMIKFQQAYNAAARLISAYDEMFSTLISRMG